MTVQRFAQALMSDAQRYVSTHFGGIDTSDLPDEVIRHTVETTYPGGWSDYERNFRRWFDEAQPKREELSPLKVKTLVEHWTRRKLREYDSILSADFSDTSVKIVLSIATVDRRSREDRITLRRMELYTFTRDDAESDWKRDYIDFEESTDEAHIRFGAVNTPEREADKREQYETCYRPGTSKAPRQGWVARAEMSWKEAHADDLPKVTKK